MATTAIAGGGSKAASWLAITSVSLPGDRASAGAAPAVRMSRDKLWWYLALPQLLLDEQLSLQSEIQRQQPQVLCRSDGQRARTVVQANTAARHAGVKLGMAEVTASTLVPELQQRTYDEQREEQVLQRLAQWLHQDIAQIALYPPQGLLLEVDDLQRLYGDYAGVQRQLARRLARVAVGYQIAAGYSPLVARILAQVPQLRFEPMRAAKSELLEKLRQVPLRFALLPAAQQQQLENVGIQCLGDLLQLPVGELGARFGRAMVAYVAELQGELLPPQRYYRPPLKFSERLDLMTEVASWQQLLFPLRRLLQQLEAFLQSRQLSVTSFTLLAHHRDQSQTPVRIAFALPLWRQREMQQLVQLQLERQQLATPALELSLRADAFQAREVTATSWLPAQQDATAQRAEQQQLQALLGKLQARLGTAAVQQAQAQNDWRPEAAQQWQTDLQTAKGPSQGLPRPLWLLPEPEAIAVHEWQLQWGPERIQTGWWDGEGVLRDYFIAVDALDRQGWIFRSHEEWYLHGWFS
ncbi:DNA polymerase Y family protein [Pseudidiomarina sp. 1APP75-27a]|nr:DNA polymerase Y family protein [Pseudidiomarina sp. 1APP75-27a]